MAVVRLSNLTRMCPPANQSLERSQPVGRRSAPDSLAESERDPQDDEQGRAVRRVPQLARALEENAGRWGNALSTLGTLEDNDVARYYAG